MRLYEQRMKGFLQQANQFTDKVSLLKSSWISVLDVTMRIVEVALSTVYVTGWQLNAVLLEAQDLHGLLLLQIHAPNTLLGKAS